MRERPIPFTGPEVLAVLEGRKTQTRRPIKPQPMFIEPAARWSWPIPKNAQKAGCATACVTASREWHEYVPTGCCPYGATGTKLWVRETWQDWCPIWSGAWCGCGNKQMQADTHLVCYKAGPDKMATIMGVAPSRWRPSTNMPRWASRISLEVTAVRVQRLQEISEGDARAEGKETDEFLEYDEWQRSVAVEGCGNVTYRTLRSDFRDSWDRTYAKRGFGWASNPFVWVVEFKRVE